MLFVEFIAKPSVEAVDACALLWLDGLDQTQLHSTYVHSGQYGFAAVSLAVVGQHYLRQASCIGQPVQYTSHA
jgi:hypothetical protein